MDYSKLKTVWAEKYAIVPRQLKAVATVRTAATAFNTNIDAVLKISGFRLAELIAQTGLTKEEFINPATTLTCAKDVVHGIAKCFVQGIAEEWITEDINVYEWMRANLRYDRLQMGGQGGIVANALAVLGVQKVLAHTNSHPQLQAQQFLNLDNLFAIDEKNMLRKAAEINRDEDTPLIHWIIEFDIGDCFEAWGERYICPKSNRFIATYDPANMNFVVNQGFVNHLNQQGFDYLILSGYHNLTAKSRGVELVEESVPMIKQWKKNNPQGIIHLELASTQDKLVRAAIIEKIAPLADSIGMNERETLDALEVIDKQKYDILCRESLTAPQLFDAVFTIKQKVKTPRIQLHMFGLYITLQDKNFCITPEQNLRGMMLAATVAATKAGTGKLEEKDELLWAHGQVVSDVGLMEIERLSEYLHAADMPQTGISEFDGMEVIAVPTILIEKPLTLVGMGDTISSVSLIGAR